MDIKTLIANRKQVIPQTRQVQEWQDRAATFCKDFHIEGKWKAKIFLLSKTKRQWLEGKAANMYEIRERWPAQWKELEKAGKLGNYFFATFRKK
jgi:hypothetical protein